MLNSNWFDCLDLTGYSLSRELPEDAVADCSAVGDVLESVRYWIKALAFDAPETATKAYLGGFGAWNDEELQDHGSNLERLFWSVCCDVAEEQANEG